jgi:hypothetical protein
MERAAGVLLWTLAAAGLIGLGVLLFDAPRPPVASSDAPAPAAASAAPSGASRVAAATPSPFEWTVTHSLSAHHMLVVKVETRRVWDALRIARLIAEPMNGPYSEILVYFYPPDTKPGTLAARRVQWTRAGGYVETDFETLGTR